MPDELRKERVVEYSVFEATVTALGVTPSTLCAELGYDSSSYHNWRKKGKMPKVAAVACEGLRRRLQQHKVTILIVECTTATHLSTIKAVATGLGASVKELT